MLSPLVSARGRDDDGDADTDGDDIDDEDDEVRTVEGDKLCTIACHRPCLMLDVPGYDDECAGWDCPALDVLPWNSK